MQNNEILHTGVEAFRIYETLLNNEELSHAGKVAVMLRLNEHAVDVVKTFNDLSEEHISTMISLMSADIPKIRRSEIWRRIAGGALVTVSGLALVAGIVGITVSGQWYAIPGIVTIAGGIGVVGGSDIEWKAEKDSIKKMEYENAIANLTRLQSQKYSKAAVKEKRAA